MNLNEIINIFIAISNNTFILLSIVFLYTLTNYELNRNKRIKQTTSGVVIGLVALFLMSNPLPFREGVVFDTRTILLSITGLFFGPITAIIAAAISIAYRVYMGGSGMMVGVLTIVFSISLGILWRYLGKKIKFKNQYLEYYLFGLITHAIIVPLFLTIPDNIVIMQYVTILFVVLYPIIVMLACVVIKQQQFRIAAFKLEIAQKILLQSSIDATHNIEIYSVDSDYKYLTFNVFHKRQVKKFFDMDIEVGDNILNIFDTQEQKIRVKGFLDRCLAGELHNQTVEIDLMGRRILDEYFTPIERGKEIIGATVFINDTTEQKTYEESILILSYYDALTNLPNRRYFQEKLIEVNDDFYNPVSIIMCDVNGLKLFNDALGHEMGDKVLIKISEILSKFVEHKGYLCRIGGDEFVFLLPNTTKSRALLITEHLDKLFDNLMYEGVRLSISYGLATKNTGDHLNDVIKESEEKMYRNKLFEKTSHRSEFIKSILQTLREKNPREKEHSQRVSKICIEIGKQLNMKKHDLVLLEAIASLHDIGKIAIDEAILNKPSKLTELEWEVIKKHPEIGYRIISTSPEYTEIAEDILSHHEHYNGKGYPRGLKSNDIPIRARIISIADAYDAMISKRTYKEPMSHDEAIAEIIRCRGTQFDPKLVDIFIRLINQGILKISLKKTEY